MADEVGCSLEAPRLPPLRIDMDESGDSVPLINLFQHMSTTPFTTQSSCEADAAALDEHEAGSSDLQRLHTSDDSHTYTSRSTSFASSTTYDVQYRPQSFPTHAFRTLLNAAGSLDSKIKDLAKGSGFTGWRMGVLLSCLTSFMVLCCNFAIIAVGAASGSGYNANGISDMINGDETTISRWITALHVLINALSTLLLAGSNYTMQVLNSPTRRDVDTAHAKGQWLDIGILSPRNLQSIPRKRTVLWYILALSSIPLHLFYNSSVFKIVTAGSYNILTVNTALDEWRKISDLTDHGNWTKGDYWNLTNGEWSNIYNTQYLSMHGDLYLGIDRVAIDTDTMQNFTNLDLLGVISSNLTLDLSGSRSTLNTLTRESSQWIRYSPTPDVTISAHVAQVSSQKRPSLHSRVQVSLIFLVVVVCFNLLKLIVMIYVPVTDRSTYLVTLGDAAASFLEHPDPHTINKCLLGREEFLLSLEKPPSHPVSNREEQEDLDQRIRGVWLPRPRRYFYPVHRAAKVLYTLVLLLITILLGFAPVHSKNKDGSSGTWSWGTTTDDFLFLSASSISATATLWNAWLSNMPQLLLSFCYLNVNLVCTSMAGSEEWNNLGSSRKGLRVTQPHGHQRSTYFLQLPYRWSLPLIITSGTLHWLLSQTFFLVRIDFFNRDGSMLENSSKSACGFSTLSLIILLFASLLLLGVVGFMGFRSMSMKIPIVASCSLAISAACHTLFDESDPHLAKVQWGVIKQAAVDGFGHCSLSSRPVKKPRVGQTYY